MRSRLREILQLITMKASISILFLITTSVLFAQDKKQQSIAAAPLIIEADHKESLLINVFQVQQELQKPDSLLKPLIVEAENTDQPSKKTLQTIPKKEAIVQKEALILEIK